MKHLSSGCPEKSLNCSLAILWIVDHRLHGCGRIVPLTKKMAHGVTLIGLAPGRIPPVVSLCLKRADRIRLVADILPGFQFRNAPVRRRARGRVVVRMG